VSQPWIPTGERSGLLTLIVTMESGSLCVRMKSGLRFSDSNLGRAVVFPGELQFPDLINACGRIAEKSRDVTESNFSPILQLSVTNRNTIDMCPIC
jgi:hypothetical protein